MITIQGQYATARVMIDEIDADTRRQMTVLTPQKRTQRQPQSLAGNCVYITAGRKRIKIYC